MENSTQNMDNENNAKLARQVEALLFIKGDEPMSEKSIANILEVSVAELSAVLINLDSMLQDHGICLMRNESQVMLGTAPELSSFLEKLQKEESNKEISKAALETLSIIFYLETASKGDIDYIRGVNSSFSLRNLLIRGLIEKKELASGNNKIVYVATLEALAYMGVTKLSDIPDYEEMRKALTDSLRGKDEAK